MSNMVVTRKSLESLTKINEHKGRQGEKEYIVIDLLATRLKSGEKEYLFETSLPQGIYEQSQFDRIRSPLEIEFVVYEHYSGLNFWKNFFCKAIYSRARNVSRNISQIEEQIWKVHVEEINRYLAK